VRGSLAYSLTTTLTASTTILTRAEQVLSPATRTASAVWMKVLGVDDSLARFAIKREVSLLCGAT